MGAGSAGCVLANRLSADPRNQVLLIEAGGDNRNFLVNMPKGIGKLVMDPKHSWQYPVAQKRGGAHDINESWVRGRGLGGSSAVNGMIWVRGQPQDYDHWEQEAGPEWGWAKMKQAFRAIEDHELGDDGVRGAGGPVHVGMPKFRYGIIEKAIEAGQQMGLARHEELNREDQEGVGYYSFNIKQGKRQSGAVAFLDPVRQRKNLHVVTDHEVQRIRFDARRASAVECRNGAGLVSFTARREIILSAGAIGSPKLLQLSGIGPGELLRKQGVAVVQESRDVGRRLLEHLGVSLTHRLRGERGINHRYRGAGLMRSMLEYTLFHGGPMAEGAMEAGAFVRSSPGAARPNAQLYFTGVTFDVPKDKNIAAPMQSVEREPGLTIYGQLIALTSEGKLQITGPEHAAPLEITPNWLSTAHDRQELVNLLHYMRRYAAQPALAPYLAAELSPGPAVQSDAEILDAGLRLASCGTHAVRSCRMGRDADSVVDERLRVRGVQGLRIADCSVMPGLVSGNTNAPAMATGWRAAELILEDAGKLNAA